MVRPDGVPPLLSRLRLPNRLLAATALAAVLTLPAAAGVLVVDLNGAPGTYPHLQPAIDAAQDGDLILVRPGDYRTVVSHAAVLAGKALTIAADPPGSSVIVPGLRIQGVAPPRRVVVRGLDLVPSILQADTVVDVVGSPGGVWFEDCHLVGLPGGAIFFLSWPGEPGVLVDASAVTLVRCVATGGDGAIGTFTTPGTDGGDGVKAVNGSSVAVHDSLLNGGLGGQGAAFSGNGGAGVRVEGSSLLLAGSNVFGGTTPGAGGDMAALVADGNSSVRLLDSQLTGGGSAPPIQAPPGVVADLGAIARAMEVTAPATPGQGAVLDLRGEPGDVALLLWSQTPTHAQVFPAKGWLLVGPSVSGPIAIGPLPAPDGDLSLPFTTPPLPPGVTADTILAQGFFLGANGDAVAGAPSAFVRRP